MRIVPAAIDKIESLWQAFDAVAREEIYLESLTARPIDEVRLFQQKLIDNNYPAYYALDNEGGVVGCVDITPVNNPRMSHRGFLGMAILKEYRGQGLGTKLLTRALAHAKEIGLEKVELQVYADNAAAIGLYKKCGFEKTGYIKHYRKLNGRYFDAVEMEVFL